MPARTLNGILLSGVALAWTVGCGRSFVFNPVAESSSGGSGGGETTAGESGGGSSGANGGSSSGGNGVTGGTVGGSTGVVGNGGNNGGNVGGSTGASGCTPGGPTTALSPCTTASDCGCPLVCTSTLVGQSLCEEPCQSTSDCSALYTKCQAGSCQPNLCGVGGLGQVDGTCDAAGQNDGTCLALSIMGFNVGLCYQGGTATTSCSITATRGNLAEDCVAGDFCTGVSCAQVCNPNGSVPCSGGDSCVAPIAMEPSLGFCVGANGGGIGGIGGIGGNAASGGNGGGSGGSTIGGNVGGNGGGGCAGPPTNCSCPANCTCESTCQNGAWTCSVACGGNNGGNVGGNVGGSSGGNNGGSTGSACNPQLAVNELGTCESSADCGCPTTCVADALEGNVCEYPCSQTSDCPNLYTVCTGVSCTVDLCGVAIGGPPNGSFDGPCNSAGVGDGTCFPTASDGGETFGICSESGTSQTNCSTTATRSDPSQACAQGYLCGQGLGSSNICYQVCNPTVSASPSVCRSNQTCTAFDPSDPQLGVCYP